MTSDRDPPRLLDRDSGLDPRLRVLLQAGRDELPSAARLEAMAARVDAACGLPQLERPHAEPPPAGASAGLSLPSLAGLTVAMVVATGALWWATAPGRWATEPAPKPLPAASPPAPVPVVPPPSQPSSAEGAEPLPREVEPAAPPGDSPMRERASGAAPADPLAELGLLDEAQRALETDPARALARAEVHRRRFPGGQYAQEREVIAIEALLELERFAAAEQRVRAFLRRFPASSHAVRVSRLGERARSEGRDVER